MKIFLAILLLSCSPLFGQTSEEHRKIADWMDRKITEQSARKII